VLQRVHLFQPGVSHGKGRFQGFYLPYSVCSVWSHANARPAVRASYELAGVVFRREPPDEVLARLERPAIACFSSYVWNWRWNLFVAKALKERHPDCLVVFGGPQVPERENHSLFADHPFIDVAVHGEGEATFSEILERRLAGQPLDGIVGASLPGPDRRTIWIGRRPRLELQSAELASPFLDGTFDALLAANPGVRWHAALETNRGCPFRCTFCDWGSLIYAKVKRFDLDKVMAEIDWLGRSEVEYVFMCDANFGVFHERDGAIVDRLIATRQATGHPKVVAATWNKNSSARTLDVARRLDAAGLSRGITLSVQSMNPATLAAVKRDNLKFSDLGSMFALAEAAGVPAVTEMILGLPEETYETWVDGVCQVLELGNHSAVTFYPAELLENAELATPASRGRHGIQSKHLANWAWDPDSLDVDGVEEWSEVVTATGTLPHEDYLDALMYSWMILNLHVDGWTQLLARGVRRFSESSYRAFYDALKRFILAHPESLLGQEYDRMRRSFRDYFATGRQAAGSGRYGTLQVQGYMQLHATQYALRRDHERAWAEIESFFDALDHGLPAALASDLVGFQGIWLTRFGRPLRQTHVARHNVWEYLVGTEPLRDEATTYELEVLEPYDQNDLDDFLNKVYFRRRAGFGKLRVRRSTAAHARDDRTTPAV
jgi:hypothetical protein